MPTFWLDSREAAETSARHWWLFVLSGFAWMLVALIVFRFNWASVLAIAVLFGCIAIAAGIAEFAAGSMSVGGWKVLHYILGVVFVGIGVLSFFTPGGTFVALAAIVSFFFVVAGTFDIVTAIVTRPENGAWWFQLLAGAAQVGLGFWAAGNWSRSVVLLVAWVGATATFRGVAMIMFGVRLRALQEELVEPASAVGREPQRRRRPVESYGS